MNYHGLADFRVDHGAFLDGLLSRSVAALIVEGLVDLDEVAVDGTKVKASASKGSFAGARRIDRVRRFAEERMSRLRAEVDADPGASSRRRKAAEARAARDVAERAEKARRTLEQLEEEKKGRTKTHPEAEAKKETPRVSLTDPEARWMRFADGSVRAGYNVQVAATGKGIVLAVTATDRRNDVGLAVPMVENLEQRYGRVPRRLLVDTKYATADDIRTLASRPEDPVLVYAPPPPDREDVKPETLKRRQASRAKEAQVLKDWRSRMDTSAGQDIYRRRKRIELVNAHFKNRGFGRPTLRGLAKITILALWHALAHNIFAARRLRPAAA